MTPVRALSRRVDVPDPPRVERARRAPEVGPQIVFFTGGSAAKQLTRALKRYTHRSVHLITPFDSGGSSAPLRVAFGMLAVGDLRNRLIALADESAQGNPETYALLSYRLPEGADAHALADELGALADGTHPLAAAVPAPLRHVVRTSLQTFARERPPGFDLRGASIGNLTLAGGWLAEGRDLGRVLFRVSQLLQCRGVARPVVDGNLHLAARLAGGRVVTGQHRLTGAQGALHPARPEGLYLCASLDDPTPVAVDADPSVLQAIADAELICFPMGSLYTSVLAALLPAGIGRAIRASRAPKLFVPNTGVDPEAAHVDLAQAVDDLLSVLRRDAGAETPASELLDLVLVDRSHASYSGGAEAFAHIEALGISLLDAALVTEVSAPLLDAQRLAEALISLV